MSFIFRCAFAIILVFNMFSRVDSFFIVVILVVLEERCVGSILGHRSSSFDKFLIGSYSPSLVVLSGPSIVH
jgi:hypothetical protein